MIVSIEGLADGVIGMRAVGEFSVEDYAAIVDPAIARLEIANEAMRLLLFLGPEFTGFGEGAWGDLTDGIRHIHFHRGAVVTDDGGIRTGLNVLKWVLRGDVRTFQNHEYDKAVRWVAG